MAVSIVRWYFQGPGKKSKKGNLSVSNKKLQKNEKKIERMYAVWGTAFRVHVRDVCIYLKRKSQLVGPKSEEKQDKDDYTCQGPSDGILGQWSHDQLPKMVKKQKL